jgi:hypothetical protein
MAAGIFCIENWTGDLRSKATVLPLLEFLAKSDGTRFVHQRVSTPRELRHYLGRFAALAEYRVGYLAVHGDRGVVRVGRHELTLEHLAAWSSLETAGVGGEEDLDDPEWIVDLTGKVLYLGSCSSLRVTHDRLDRLRRVTGARVVCGYTKPVDWFASGAFDVMLLSALADAMDRGRPNPAAAIKRLRRQAGDLLDHLGFVSVPDWVARTNRPATPQRDAKLFRQIARLRNAGADWYEIESRLGIPRPTLAKIRTAALDSGHAIKEANGRVTWRA